MSKWLNELNIINLKLYMFHMLIRRGVMTSHIRIQVVNLLKVSKNSIGHLNNSRKNIEGREISHINTLSWTYFVIVITH